MEPRKPPDFVLELSADRSNVKDIVKGILHTLFFHRLFTPLQPSTHELLDLTLPYIPTSADETIPSLIETKTTALLRHLDAEAASTTTSPQYHPPTRAQGQGQRATVTLSFLEKKRKKGWFIATASESTVWESWSIHLTLLSARSEVEASRNRRVMERQLGRAVVKVVEVVNRERGHIPPITTNEGSLFPCEIIIGAGGGR